MASESKAPARPAQGALLLHASRAVIPRNAGLKRAPWWVCQAAAPLIVLIAFGGERQTPHASPPSPIAFALLIVAAIWLWPVERRARAPKSI